MLAPDGGGGGFAGITEAVLDLKKAATTGGGFTISDDGAQTLINSLQEVHDKVTMALAKGYALGQQPQLGGTPAANTYKPFLATIWSDGTQGGQKALTKLKQDLEDAMDTLRKNSASYQHAEQLNRTQLA